MNLFELFVKIGVDDQASGNLSKITDKLGNGLKTAAKIGTAAVTAAGAAIVALTKTSIDSYAEYEQLAGGAAKIFDEMSQTQILQDAQNAYKELGLSANQYLAVINDVGATFAATMGDEAGYEAAKTGLKAISDYASGTGKNVDELSQKFTLITRSTSSYQSIADQFSGILPATSAGFLKQAQAAGILSDSYTQLTEVPIDEYQAAVSQMLEKGVEELGLANNAANEAATTISGSLAAWKGSWSNLVTGLADDSADFDKLMDNFIESTVNVGKNIIPTMGKALNGIGLMVDGLAPIIAETLPGMVESLLPSLLDAAAALVTTLFDSLPGLIESLLPVVIDVALSVVMAFINTVTQNAGLFMQVGIDAIVQIVTGIANSLPQIISSAITIVSEMFTTLTNAENLNKMLEAAMTLIESIVTGLIDNIPQLVEAAIEIVQNLVDFITKPGNLQKLLQMALELVITIMEGIIDAIPQLTTAAIELVMQLVKFILDPGNIAILLQMSLEIVLAIVDGLLAASGELINGAVELITELCNTFLETDWAQIGSDIINTLWSGLQSAWKSVASWFNGVWDSLFGNRSVDVNANVTGGVSTDGSHAGGLPYVPFDGYIAELHKGERVLTADEARGYNNRSNSGYDERPIKIVVQSVLDGKVIGETAYNYNRRRARAGGT